MSTIIVVQKDGIAAIAADTMAKWGSRFERADYIQNHSKIVEAEGNLIGHVGHASLGLVLESYFDNYELNEPLHDSRAVFEFARALHVALKEDYFLNPTEDTDDPFESSQTYCLIANSHGIFGLYSLRSVQQYTKFYAFGSGSEYAMGAMYAVYDLPNYNAEAIACAGVEAAANFDDGTGLPVEVRTVKLRA